MDATVGIIGAGPAGISAGVQLRRYRISHIIVEKNRIGGLVTNAYLLENTMLYPSGIKGSEFVNILEEYAKKYKLPVIFERVNRVEKEKNFVLLTDSRVYKFKYLIVATGTMPRKLPFQTLKYHITDMERKRYEEVLVIGGGDIALDYALSMSHKSSKVYVLYRSDIKAIPVLQERVRRRENIQLVRGEVKNIISQNDKKEIITTAGKFLVDEVLAAIGRVPNLEIVKDIQDPRLFIIGDAINGIYRQTSLAIGDGIKVAMKIWRWERYGNPE